MNKAYLSILFGVGFLAVNSSALAESALTKKIMKIARDNITNAGLSDGSNVKPETKEELKSPIIAVKDAEKIIEVGQQSAIAKWCGLDWQGQSYLPLMKRERAKKTLTDKQLAYIGLMHGIAMGVTEKAVAERGECSEKQRQHTLKRMEKNS